MAGREQTEPESIANDRNVEGYRLQTAFRNPEAAVEQRGGDV